MDKNWNMVQAVENLIYCVECNDVKKVVESLQSVRLWNTDIGIVHDCIQNNSNSVSYVWFSIQVVPKVVDMWIKLLFIYLVKKFENIIGECVSHFVKFDFDIDT